MAAALPPDTATWGALLGWLAADAIAVVLEPDPDARVARGWFDRARLGRVFADAYRWRGLDERAAWWTVETVRHLVARPGAAALVAPAGERAGRLVRAWFADDDLGRWLGVNRHEGIAYLNRESFEAALRWMVVLVAVDGPPEGRDDDGRDGRGLAGAHALALRLAADAEAAGYEVGRLVELRHRLTDRLQSRPGSSRGSVRCPSSSLRAPRMPAARRLRAARRDRRTPTP